MAQPNKEDSKLADSSANPQIGERGAAVTAAAAATASSTAALTSVDIAFTWTANDPGITNGAATIADGNTVGDDNDAGDPLSVIEDQYIKLRADLIATNVEVDADIVDVALIRTALNDLIDRLEAHGLLADN